MAARTWLNLGLLMLVAVLALLVWLRPGAPAPEVQRLTSLNPDAITRIAIKPAKKPAIEFELRNGGWWLISPIKMPANEIRLASIINLATTTSDTRYSARKLELENYGLAEPSVMVTLNQRTLDFGDINTVTYQRYVRVGNTVQLISDDIPELATADAASYVQPALLPEKAKLRALTLPKLKLERAEDGKWISSPAGLSQAEIEALLGAWRQAQAYQVTAYQQTGQEQSHEQVTVNLASGKQYRFVVVAQAPDLVLAHPNIGIQYHLLAADAKSLLGPGVNAAAATSGDGD
jgi:hypothetical protein